MKTNMVSDKVLKLANFNLNLLTTFCLIYSTRSITEVSEILEVTPPSVSHALRKLRLHFEDPLFIRHGNTIAPTVFADDLYTQLKQTLEIMSDSIARSKQTNKRETWVIYSPFSVAVHDLSSALIKIKLAKLNFKIKYIETILGIPDAVGLLNLRKADLVFSGAPVVSTTLTCVLFCELTPVLVCRQDNPFQKTSISIDDLKNMDMVTHLTGDEMIYQRKQSLLATLKNAQVAFETNSILMLLTLLSETDCIGFITQDAFTRYRDIFKLRQLTPLFPVQKISVYLVYRKELEKKASFMQFLEAMKNN
ncbi:LysR family transcriptional regulator [Buttiauxella sp. 3AFRM03]|uniref:LysR family transcriptional regulator n=1 Tax=Buttiauxella sp. 3AFRM03 TaxID=2479367 RepID=UPI000EF83D29|nr:LysR family transcriptional regulator [Buttiauxella sp. 3AFRM03]AYN27631.1 LysR family transcriptional regulator [Buttiauxella sp. 3AFRM03]